MSGVKSSVYDVVVVGAGPAGLSAAMNVANRKRSVAVFDGARPFSYARRAPHIPNYPGFTFTTGEELADSFMEHLERFDVPVFQERVTRIIPAGDELYLSTDQDTYTARAVVLATGIKREAELEGEEELVGRGVSYCVNCDGRLYAGKDVVVVGYVPEGEEEAAALADDMGARVTYIPLYEGDFDVPEEVQVLANLRPDRLERRDGRIVVALPDRELDVDGVFIYTQSVSPKSIVDGLSFEGRHIAVDRQGRTGIDGLFAAGDCTGEPYQIAKAVGEGQVAALQAVRRVRTIEQGRSREAEQPDRGAGDVAGDEAPSAAGGARAAGAPAQGSGGAERREEDRALSDEDRENLARILETMQAPVRLIHFTQTAGVSAGFRYAACDEARRLITEFSELSPKLRLELHDFLEDHDLAEGLGIERIPATAVLAEGEDRPRLRFFGLPAGYEFGPFLDAVLSVSKGEGGVEGETLARLEDLSEPVRLEVLTTSTCPNCPAAVRLAHRFALASPLVAADMVVANEFPDLAQRYEVRAVPKLMINGEAAPEGPLNEDRLAELILEAGGAT